MISNKPDYETVRDTASRATQLLLADDDEILLKMLHRELSAKGYACTMVSDGEATLKALHEHHFDVALLDLHMPKLDGFQVLRRIKEFGLSVIPIVFTGMGNVPDSVKAIKLGAYDFVEKPCNPEILGQAIARAKTHRDAKAYSRQMAAVAEQWESTFNAAPDPIVAIDLAGKIICCNSAAQKKADPRIEEISTSTFHAAFCPQDHPLEECRFNANLDSAATRSFELPFFDGVFEFLSAPFVDVDGNVCGRLFTARDMTQRRKAEEALMRSEERYRTLFMSSHDAIMTIEPPSFAFTSGNPACLKMFEVADEESFKSLAPDLLSPPYQADGSPSGEKALEMIQIAMDQGSHLFEWRHKRYTGEEFPAMVSLTRIALDKHLFLQATVRDITQQRQAEESLRQSEEIFRTITKNVDDAILLVSLEGRISFYNAAAEKLFGWRESEALNKEVVSLLAPECYRAQYQEALQDLFSHEQGIMAGKANELIARRKDGSEFPVELSSSKVKMRNAWYSVGILRDISERKKIEGDQRRAQAELQESVAIRTQELAKKNTQLLNEITERKRAVNEMELVNRILRTISECKQAMVSTMDEMDLMQSVCSILVERGKYCCSWIGVEGNEVICPVVWAGFASGDALKEAQGRLPLLRHEQRTSSRLQEPTICRDLKERKDLDLWSAEAARQGCVAHIAIPFRFKARSKGILHIYSFQEEAFSDQEVGLLKELASDLRYGISSVRNLMQRKRTESQLNRLSSLKEKLISADSLAEKLGYISDAIIDVFEADFARIWTIGKGDHCEQGCIHNEVLEEDRRCQDKTQCLHLLASSGRYTHIDGDHSRVPLGCYKIGQIAACLESSYVTNTVLSDPKIHHQAWAQELGLQSFAGWRLLSQEGETLGVMALFSKKVISPEDERLLTDLSNTVTHVISADIVTRALHESESKIQAILHGCPMPQFAIDKEHRIISWNAPLEEFSGLLEKDVLGTTRQWEAFYPQERPCMVDLLVDGTLDELSEYYAGKYLPSALVEGAYEATDFFQLGESEGRWLHFTAVVIRDKRGEVIGGVETLEDITEKKLAEEKLRRSYDELEERVQQRTQQLSESNASLLDEIDRREEIEKALTRSHHEAERLLASMSSFLIELDKDQRIRRWNSAAESLFGLSSDAVLHTAFSECQIDWDWQALIQDVPSWPIVENPVRWPAVAFRDKAGGERVLSVSLDPIKNDAGQAEGCFLLGLDVTERQELERQLNQAQKLESVGRLAAGIAHEINTPTQYVGDNIEFLQIAHESFIELTELYTRIIEAGDKDTVPGSLIEEGKNLVEDMNLDYLLEQIPRAITQSIEGIERISSIVQAMKEFSHPGQEEKIAADLNQCIRSTVTVSRNEWKYIAELNLELEDYLPQVLCRPGEINQVILNLVVNAAHAIADTQEEGAASQGSITIRTLQEGDCVEIRVQDTGTGIPKEVCERIFDPFFTTKEVGKGTGQGLAIARNVIVDKHGGTIAVDSKLGEGTTFIIRLPITS